MKASMQVTALKVPSFHGKAAASPWMTSAVPEPMRSASRWRASVAFSPDTSMPATRRACEP
jgi:hypothetical protein